MQASQTDGFFTGQPDQDFSKNGYDRLTRFRRNLTIFHEDKSAHEKYSADFGFQAREIVDNYFAGNVARIEEADRSSKSVPTGVLAAARINYVSFRKSSSRSIFSHAIDKRIKELRQIAAEEDVPLSESSIERGVDLLKSLDFNVLPSIFLAANGNLRFVWENSSKERAAFQVKPENYEVQYVVFRMNKVQGFDQILGVMSFESVARFLEEIGLSSRLLGVVQRNGGKSSARGASRSLRRWFELQSNYRSG